MNPQLTKRQLLVLVGASVGGAALTERTRAQSSYSNTVDIVEAGADNTGNEPINPVLEDVVADDTLVEFPPGTYLMDREFAYDDARHVGLVGTNGSGETTILIEDTFEDSNLFDFGTTGSYAADGITFEGFTVDMTMAGAGTCIFWAYCLDDCYIEDIVVDGVLQGKLPSGKGEILVRVDIMNSDGSGLIRNFSAPDGAEYAGSGQPATGIYIGGAHAGSITIENCEIAGFHDNGVYTSAASDGGGDVTIRGGRYANNDVSNVRVGGVNTLVEGVSIVQDSTEGFIYNNPRGLYARNGNCTVRDVSIDYYKGESEAIQVGSEMGRVDLENVTIHQKTDQMSIFCRPNSSTFTADGLTVVAEGAGYEVMDAQDGTIDITNSCVEATDGDRDGLLFESADASVSDSTVDVAGTAIDGATTTNVSYDGGCSLTGDTAVSVSTGPASSIGTTEATLEGSLDDLGGAELVDVWFGYREVGASSWTETAAETRSSTGSFSSVVTGLSSGTDYEFRAVASASDGDTDTGTVVSFTTASSDTAPVVSTGSASGIDTTEVTLDGSLDDLGGADSVDVWFDYRPAGTSSWTGTASETLSTTGAYSTVVSGLDSQTDYEFRAAGSASDGDADTGTVVSFTTDTVLDVATDGATAIDVASATLQGTLQDLGDADSADVAFEYGELGTALDSTTDTSVLSSTGSYSIDATGLDAGTDYEFAAIASASDGDSDTGGTSSFTTDSSTSSTAPTIDSYTVVEAGSPNPHFEPTADWSVSDQDGDLDTVTVDVVDMADRLVDRATTAVSGSSASGSDSFKIKHANDATFDVILTVADSQGNTTKSIRTLSE